MADEASLAIVLERYLRPSGYTPGRLAQLTDVPKATIVNWLEDRVRKPQTWEGLVRVAAALSLSASQTTELLRAGGQPAVHELLRHVGYERDRALLALWDEPGARDQAPGRAGPAPPRLSLPLDALPEPAPLPSASRMPLHRNPLFVSRAGELQRIARAVARQGATRVATIAITGLGGIGKTQVACEFVHRYGQFFPGGVFWLSFADPTTVPAEIAACGGPGYLDLRSDFSTLERRDQLELVLGAWRGPLPRLLVFDNCEDERLLARWRPTTGGCAVLVTSRRARWEPTLGIEQVALDVFEPGASAALIYNYLPGGDTRRADVEAITEELGHLPLALHLAGSFLARSHPVVGPAAYLAQLRESNLIRHASLQGTLFSPTSHIQHVGRTFALSVKRLHPADTTDSLARRLLARAAYFAPGELIPLDLLFAGHGADPPETTARALADAAVVRLATLGLVELGVDRSLRLHRLIAAYVRANSGGGDARSDVEQALADAASVLNAADDVPGLHRIYRHLRYVADAAYERADERSARLCAELGYYLWRANDWPSARHYLERAVAIYDQSSRYEPLQVARALQSLGLALQVQGRLEQAHAYFARAIDILEHACGGEHLATSDALTNLGFLLILKCDYARALGLLRRSLAIRRAASGLRHAETGHILHSLGLLYLRWGRYTPARRYLKLALAVRRSVLPARHIALGQTLYFLGEAAYLDGALATALEYHEHGLAIRRSLLGERNAATAESLYGLGRVLEARGEACRARATLEQSADILLECVGAENMLTVSVFSSLGALLRRQGSAGEARHYLERALVSWERAGEQRDAELVGLLHELALVYLAQEAAAEARAVAERSLRVSAEKLGANHPATARSACILHRVAAREEQATVAESSTRPHDRLSSAG